MCRPNYSQWILGENKLNNRCEVFSIPGEGSHSEIAEKLHLNYYRIPQIQDLSCCIFNNNAIPELLEFEYKEFCLNNFFPFECIWSESPIIKFQPNRNRFYNFDELPTEMDFKAGQERLNCEIGTIDKLFDWLKEACNFYDKSEIISYRPDQFSIFSELAKLTNSELLCDIEMISKARLETPYKLLDYYYDKARQKDNLPKLWRDRLN